MKSEGVKEVCFNYIVIPFLVFFIVLFSYLESYFLGNKFFYILFAFIFLFPLFRKHKVKYVISLSFYFFYSDFNLIYPFFTYYYNSIGDDTAIGYSMLFIKFVFVLGLFFFYKKNEIFEYLFFICFCIFSPFFVLLYECISYVYFYNDLLDIVVVIMFGSTLVEYFYCKFYRKKDNIVFKKLVIFSFFYCVFLTFGLLSRVFISIFKNILGI